MSVKNWLKFLFLGLIWGSSFLWIKIALREVGPFTLVAFRVFFAALGLLFFFLAARKGMKKEWIGRFLFVGFFNVAFPFVLISTAERSITSGMAAILNSTVPLFTILVAPIFLTEERFTLQRVAGLLLGFGGVIVLMSDRLGGGSDSTLAGIAAMLIAALSYAVSGVYARKRSADIPVEAASFGQMAGALCFILPAALIVDAPFKFPSLPVTYLALLWLGLLGSCIATLLWYSLLHSVGPTRTSMTTYMFPLVGVLLGAIFLQEKMDWHVLAGGALILLAIFIVNSRQIRVKSDPAETMAEVEGK
ncbi:MAG: DMT family transporter [Anaerolineaceae bacterium]